MLAFGDSVQDSPNFTAIAKGLCITEQELLDALSIQNGDKPKDGNQTTRKRM